MRLAREHRRRMQSYRRAVRLSAILRSVRMKGGGPHRPDRPTAYVSELGPAKSELNGPKAGEHYKKIAALAAQQFPDHTLAYLIEYGVYGLVNQIAGK